MRLPFRHPGCSPPDCSASAPHGLIEGIRRERCISHGHRDRRVLHTLLQGRRRDGLAHHRRAASTAAAVEAHLVRLGQHGRFFQDRMWRLIWRGARSNRRSVSRSPLACARRSAMALSVRATDLGWSPWSPAGSSFSPRSIHRDAGAAGVPLPCPGGRRRAGGSSRSPARNSVRHGDTLRGGGSRGGCTRRSFSRRRSLERRRFRRSSRSGGRSPRRSAGPRAPRCPGSPSPARRARSAPVPDHSDRVHGAACRADDLGERLRSRASWAQSSLATGRKRNPPKPLSSFRIGL